MSLRKVLVVLLYKKIMKKLFLIFISLGLLTYSAWGDIYDEEHAVMDVVTFKSMLDQGRIVEVRVNPEYSEVIGVYLDVDGEKVQFVSRYNDLVSPFFREALEQKNVPVEPYIQEPYSHSYDRHYDLEDYFEMGLVIFFCVIIGVFVLSLSILLLRASKYYKLKLNEVEQGDGGNAE